MKTVSRYFQLLILAVVTLGAASSCNKDSEIAYDVNGVWSGYVTQAYYTYRGYGTSQTWDVEMEFIQDGAFSRGGHGYEYVNGRPGQYFEWYVRDSRIYINYLDNSPRVVIDSYDIYSMNNTRRFKGIFRNDQTGEELAAFNFIRTADINGHAKTATTDFSEGAEKEKITK